MVFVLIGLFLVFYAFFDFKKSFLYFLIFKMFLTGNIILISMQGFPTLTLDLFMIVSYAILFFTGRWKKCGKKVKFPFKMPFIIISISMIISAFFSWAGFASVATRTFSDIMTQYVLVYLIWEMVENEKDYEFLLKGMTMVIFISALYSFVEYAIKVNPLMSYEMSLVKDPADIRDLSYSVDMARGFRTQSIFESAIGAGINWSMFAIWIFSISIKYKKKLPWRGLAYMAATLGIVASFFAKSRTPFVFLLLGMLCFFELKSKRFVIIAFTGIIGLLIIGPMLSSDVSSVLLSLFNPNYQAVVSGSSIDLRIRTLAACLQVVSKSPIVGVGIKFQDLVNSAALRYELHGMESVWFVSLTYYGIIGVFTQLILAYFMLIKVPRKYNSKVAFFFGVAYWGAYTLSTLPGMLVYMYYLIYFYFIKQSDYYKKYQNIIVKV